MRPTIGKIVLFTESDLAQRAAIVTAAAVASGKSADDDEASWDLTVQTFLPSCAAEEHADVSHSWAPGTTPAIGCWSWPE